MERAMMAAVEETESPTSPTFTGSKLFLYWLFSSCSATWYSQVVSRLPMEKVVVYIMPEVGPGQCRYCLQCICNYYSYNSQSVIVDPLLM